MPEPEFRFSEPLRVRWAEIDAQNIVFNGHYLMYVDTAIAGYWRALALPYAQSMQTLGGDLYVRKATLEYHASARYDERLDVAVRTGRIGNSSIVFHAEVRRRSERLVSGELVYVFADPASQTARPVPAALREIFQGYEAGQPMFEVVTGSWPEMATAARALRTEVFIDELGMAAELEWDLADAAAVHAVARNRLGQVVATGRLVRRADGGVGIGRMAVVPALRGGGIGRAVLEALIQAAREQAVVEVMLDAAVDAVDVVAFYAAAGFRPSGSPSEVAGIAHQPMTRRL